MEIFATGLSMGESPRWHDGRLWVCDWVAGEVLSFDAAGERRVELTMEGLPFSIDWLPDGRAVLTSPAGVVLGDGTPYGGTGRGWNEIVVDTHGNTFVNEIGFDFMGGGEPTPGTVQVVRPDGSTRQVADDVWFPNGMALTDDGATLVVAESYRNRLSAYDAAADGSLTNRRTWAELEFAPDGICVDADGAVWYATVPGRCCIRVAEGGAVLDRVDADRGCFACMLGGDDGRTLHVIAQEWGGVEGVGGRTGRVLTHRAAAPHAGRP
jgi:sugar lactone lactonase YvrE